MKTPKTLEELASMYRAEIDRLHALGQAGELPHGIAMAANNARRWRDEQMTRLYQEKEDKEEG